jgi:hypothetical protein
MRQFFTWRFWAALAALAGIGLVLVAVVARLDDDPTGGEEVAPREHRVDLGALVIATEAVEGWGITDGVTVGRVRFVLDDGSAMSVAPGTPAELSCDALAELGGCAVLADLLGEAVVWFAVVPAGGAQEVPLAPIDDVLEGGRAARLTNGWIVPLVDRVERRCDAESTSFRDFLSRFGTDHASVYDLTVDEVAALVCTPDAA